MTSKFLPAGLAVREQALGGFSLLASAPERALLECLFLAPDRMNLEETYGLLENQRTLRPKVALREVGEESNQVAEIGGHPEWSGASSGVFVDVCADACRSAPLADRSLGRPVPPRSSKCSRPSDQTTRKDQCDRFRRNPYNPAAANPRPARASVDGSGTAVIPTCSPTALPAEKLLPT